MVYPAAPITLPVGAPPGCCPTCWYLWEVEWQCDTSNPAGGAWGVVGDHPNPPTAANAQVSCQLNPPPFEPTNQWNLSGRGGSDCYGTWLQQGGDCTGPGDCPDPVPPSIASLPTPTPGDCCDNYEVFFAYVCEDFGWTFLAVNTTSNYVTGGWQYACDTPFGSPGCVARAVITAYDWFNAIIPPGPFGDATDCGGANCCPVVSDICTTTWIGECVGGVWQINEAPGSTQCLRSDAFGCNVWLPDGNRYTYLACSATPCDPGGFPPYDCPFPGDPPGTTPTAEPCAACPPQANATGSGFGGICAANGNGAYTFISCGYVGTSGDHFIWTWANPGGNTMSVEYNAGVWTVSVPLATGEVPSLTVSGGVVSGTITANQFGFCGPAGTVVITF